MPWGLPWCMETDCGQGRSVFFKYRFFSLTVRCAIIGCDILAARRSYRWCPQQKGHMTDNYEYSGECWILALVWPLLVTVSFSLQTWMIVHISYNVGVDWKWLCLQLFLHCILSHPYPGVHAALGLKHTLRTAASFCFTAMPPHSSV